MVEVKMMVEKYILGKPQPARLYPKVSRSEKVIEFMKEWKSAIVGLVMAVVIIFSFMPFL